MKLRVTQLGPIADGELDLRAPLRLLMGPNGSGKTWFTWALYALSVVPPSRLEAALAPCVGEHLRGGQLRLTGTALDAFWQHALSALGPAVRQTLPEVFALPDEHFVQCKVRCSDVTPRPIAAVTTRDGFAYALNKEGLYIGPSDLPDRPSEVLTEERATELAAIVAVYALRPEMTPMPAERSGLQVLSSPIARAMVAFQDSPPREVIVLGADGPLRHSLPGRRTNLLGALPTPLRSFLTGAVTPDSGGPRTDSEQAVDRSLLRGTVRFEAQQEPHFEPDVEGSLPVTLPQAPSGVKALARLGRMLHESEQRGSWLILDEPEINLHPALQVELARLLVASVNRGARLLVSTHSDYVLREFSHCVMAAHPANREARAAYGYTDANSLRPEKLGVSVFQDGQVSEVPVGPYGFDTAAIDAVIARQAEVGQGLAGAIDWDQVPSDATAGG